MLRRYLLHTWRAGRRIDRDDVPILVLLDLDDRDPLVLAQSRDLLDRYLMRAIRGDRTPLDRWHEFEFAVYAADEEGKPVGPERFRWTLPDPATEEEIRRWGL